MAAVVRPANLRRSPHPPCLPPSGLGRVRRASGQGAAVLRPVGRRPWLAGGAEPQPALHRQGQAVPRRLLPHWRRHGQGTCYCTNPHTPFRAAAGSYSDACICRFGPMCCGCCTDEWMSRGCWTSSTTTTASSAWCRPCPRSSTSDAGSSSGVGPRPAGSSHWR